MISTARYCFAHEMVTGVQVMACVSKEATCGPILPRLGLDIKDNGRVVFFGEEAFSVLTQLESTGALTSDAVYLLAASLRDEIELAEAQGVR